MPKIRIVFDGPPGPVPGRFVEVEDLEGRGVNVGTWVRLPNGLWALELNASLEPLVEKPEKANAGGGEGERGPETGPTD